MIRHIVLVDSKRGIAKNGDQPVHLKIDGAYFREKTLSFGGNVLMGRTLFEMIGPLRDRQNFVATHRTEPIEGVKVVNDLAGFIQDFGEDLWIIGGAKIYDQTIEYADELYVTEITADLECDKFYPEWNGFSLTTRSEIQHENGLEYTFCIYKRK